MLFIIPALFVAAILAFGFKLRAPAKKVLKMAGVGAAIGFAGALVLKLLIAASSYALNMLLRALMMLLPLVAVVLLCFVALAAMLIMLWRASRKAEQEAKTKKPA